MKPRSMRPSAVIPFSRPRPQQNSKDINGSSRSGVAVVSCVALPTRPSSTEPPQQSTSSYKAEGREPRPNPSKQASSSSPSTPGSSVTEALYEVVVQKILSQAPPTIRSKFERSRDPRLLFPLAPDGPERKVLSEWLDTHYFIPKDLITPVPASKYAVGLDPRAPCFTASSGNNHELAASSSVSEGINTTFGKTAEACEPPSSVMKDLTNTLTTLRFSEAVNGALTPLRTESVPDAGRWTAISPLLEVSGQTVPHEFDAFILKFATGDARARQHCGGRKLPANMSWKKIGEASFSEVFHVGEVVLKIVPLEYHDPSPPTVSQPKDERGRIRPKPRPSTSLPEDVLREINATRIMGGVHFGFTSLLW